MNGKDYEVPENEVQALSGFIRSIWTGQIPNKWYGEDITHKRVHATVKSLSFTDMLGEYAKENWEAYRI